MGRRRSHFPGLLTALACVCKPDESAQLLAFVAVIPKPGQSVILAHEPVILSYESIVLTGVAKRRLQPHQSLLFSSVSEWSVQPIEPSILSHEPGRRIQPGISFLVAGESAILTDISSASQSDVTVVVTREPSVFADLTNVRVTVRGGWYWRIAEKPSVFAYFAAIWRTERQRQWVWRAEFEMDGKRCFAWLLEAMIVMGRTYGNWRVLLLLCVLVCVFVCTNRGGQEKPFLKTPSKSAKKCKSGCARRESIPFMITHAWINKKSMPSLHTRQGH